MSAVPQAITMPLHSVCFIFNVALCGEQCLSGAEFYSFYSYYILRNLYKQIFLPVQFQYHRYMLYISYFEYL